MNRNEPSNDPLSDERLSAYFDGEATPEERAAVESLLDESLAARRELDEISQLSGLLHSFPRESAPVELVANVRRQTDQMPIAKPSASPTNAPRSLRREWMAAFSGAVVTAASLFLMTRLVDLPEASESSSIALHDASPAAFKSTAPAGNVARFTGRSDDEPEALAMVQRKRVDNTITGVNDSPRDSISRSARVLAAPLPKADESKSMPQLATGAPSSPKGPNDVPAPAPAPAPAAAAGQATDPASLTVNNLALTNAFGENGGATNYYLNNNDFLDGLKVGEVYQIVPQVADNNSNVAVVNLAVLDVERGANQVQVILSKNSIQPKLPTEEKNFSKQKSSTGRDQNPTSNNEIVVVYSVGPGERLAKALEDIHQHPDLFVGWSPEPPVQLPTADDMLVMKEIAAGKKGEAAPVETRTQDNKDKSQKNSTAPQEVQKGLAANFGGDADDEAALALNALIARNTSAANGNNFLAEQNGTNFVARNYSQGLGGGALGLNRAKSLNSVAQNFNLPKQSPAAGAANNSPSDPKPASDPELSKSGGAAKRTGDAKADGDARRKQEEQRLSYQTTLRFPADAPVPADSLRLAEQLNRMNVQNVNQEAAKSRKGTGSFQTADTNSGRNAANPQSDANHVRVLFVLHPMTEQAGQPTAAPAADKQNQ